MSRQVKKTYIIIGIALILAFLAGNFAFPQFLNLPYLPKTNFKLGLDLQGGSHLVYQADLTSVAGDKGQAMEGLRDVIERRVNFFGVSEPIIQVQEERLIVELAGIIDPQEAIKQIGKTPFLEFKEQKPNFDEIIEKNRKALEEKKEADIEDPFVATALTGRYLKKAEISFDQTTYRAEVSLGFNDEGAKLFEQISEKNVGKILAIYIDDVPISTPRVQEKISGGKAQITGNFSMEEAKSLARNLNAGALPVPISLISQQSVGPTLGKVSLERSLTAGIFGFLAILLFMIVFYRLPGFFASLSLLMYVFFILAMFKMISVTLTLAGIAGFVLSMGMAVDANILIFSRLKEELKQSNDYLAALEVGVKRAWPSIRDGNLTTILVGLILFSFGTSFVKGFALTLVIGNLFGMFTAIVITSSFLKALAEKLQKRFWLWSN